MKGDLMATYSFKIQRWLPKEMTYSSVVDLAGDDASAVIAEVLIYISNHSLGYAPKFKLCASSNAAGITKRHVFVIFDNNWEFFINRITEWCKNV